MVEKATAPDAYAIFKTGGKQYQAVPGKTVAVEKLNVEPGQKISFNEVLVRKTLNPAGQAVIEIGQPFLTTAITALVIKHDRAPKIIVFRFKRRKKYKRKTGHRQPYTVLRIETI